ncbi:MAG: hypothetical protein JNJ95_00940 [Dechloromonas sp.]|nr:hypothetical protein [Dechloromonas sp.]
MSSPRCSRCAHYFITHELPFRYGCHALDFKSTRAPELDVIASSGEACLYFQPKAPANPPRRGM